MKGRILIQHSTWHLSLLEWQLQLPACAMVAGWHTAACMQQHSRLPGDLHTKAGDLSHTVNRRRSAWQCTAYAYFAQWDWFPSVAEQVNVTWSIIDTTCCSTEQCSICHINSMQPWQLFDWQRHQTWAAHVSRRHDYWCICTYNILCGRTHLMSHQLSTGGERKDMSHAYDKHFWNTHRMLYVSTLLRLRSPRRHTCMGHTV